jgi:hypothetical protein
MHSINTDGLILIEKSWDELASDLVLMEVLWDQLTAPLLWSLTIVHVCITYSALFLVTSNYIVY